MNFLCVIFIIFVLSMACKWLFFSPTYKCNSLRAGKVCTLFVLCWFYFNFQNKRLQNIFSTCVLGLSPDNTLRPEFFY